MFPIALGVQSRDFQQKTFAINQFYDSGPNNKGPLGVIQAAGNTECYGVSRLYRPFIDALLNNSFQTFVMSEAPPTVDTGCGLSDDGAKVNGYPLVNTRSFDKLRRIAKDSFRAAGYQVFAPGLQTNFHNVGTALMGRDPATSVIDDTCREHEVDDLYLVDSCSLPTPGALNSGLTVAAVALRTAEACAARL